MKTNLTYQRGATLLVALIMLLAMTAMGVAMMRSSQTELQIVRNTQDKSRTFQAAESLVAYEQTRDDLAPLSAPGYLPDSGSNVNREFTDTNDALLATGSGTTQYMGDGLASGYSLTGSTTFRAFFFESTGTATGGKNATSTIRVGYYVVAPSAS